MLALDQLKRHTLPEGWRGHRRGSRNSSLPRLDTAVDWDAPLASSPPLPTSASSPSIATKRNSIIRSIRALSLTSPPTVSPSPSASVVADAAELSTSRSPRTLKKQRTPSGGNIASLLGRRGSSRSDFNLGTSHENTSASQSSTNSIDGTIQWDLQAVRGVFKIIREHHFRKNGLAYLVVTGDYIVKVKTAADVRGLFPKLSPDMIPPAPAGPGGAVSAEERSHSPEPLQTIPVASVISASRAESSRPYFGLEVWWKSAHSLAAFGACQFFAEDPNQRDLVLESIHEAVRAKDDAHFAVPRVPYEIEQRLCEICRKEEPDYSSIRPEIFPVGIRLADNAKWAECESYYFAVGLNLCYFAKVTRHSDNRSLVVSYAKYGLMSLECVLGRWSPREDRLELRFRKPFESSPSYIHISSRFYYQIIQTLLKADECLRPCWPSRLRRTQLFRVDNLPASDEDVAADMSCEFGGLHRTHKAFCAAYDCRQIEWEICLDGTYGPELRILPPPPGRTRHEALELLALMRAARYNWFIGSISFRGISLASLWNRFDSSRPGAVAYISHDGHILSSKLCKPVQGGSILAQEIHALAFCLPALRQVDFTDSLTNLPYLPYKPDLQVLAPILNLVSVGLTNCNRILLSGCPLGPGDVNALVNILSRDDVGGNVLLPASSGLEALDISRCSLCSQEMFLVVEALTSQSRSLQVLDLSQNTGRVAADVVARFVDSMTDLRILNLADTVVGPEYCALMSYESLCAFHNIQEIDISGYKLSMDTEQALTRFFEDRAAAQRVWGGYVAGSPRLRQLKLNDCSIDGFQAARILAAASGLEGLHLHLSSNPLEHGIEELASAIALCSEGSFALHMDMVEFQRDENYVRLIQALTVSKRFPLVSLAGTAPTPLPSAICTDAVCDALEELLAQNKSIRWLDLSGYVGKLDDGQLGRGFGRAFRALGRNTTLRVLILRNQNLSTEVGGLGSGIQGNRTLRRLDCSGSELNVASLLFLRRSLQESCGSLVEFPFGRDQQQRLLDRALQHIQGPARIAAEKDLRQEVEREAGLIEKILAHNRSSPVEQDSDDGYGGRAPDVEETADEDMVFAALDGDENVGGWATKPSRHLSRRVLSSAIPIEPFASPYRLLGESKGHPIWEGDAQDMAGPMFRLSWDIGRIPAP